MTGTPQGATHCVEADVHEPAHIVDAARHLLDVDRPIAVTLLAVLHLLADDTDAHQILKELTAPLRPGSALALTVATADTDPAGARAAQTLAAKHGLPVTLRSQTQTQAQFTGLDLIDPGVTLVHHWRPDPADPQPADPDVHLWAGIALKPED